MPDVLTSLFLTRLRHRLAPPRPRRKPAEVFACRMCFGGSGPAGTGISSRCAPRWNGPVGALLLAIVVIAWASGCAAVLPWRLEQDSETTATEQAEAEGAKAAASVTSLAPDQRSAGRPDSGTAAPGQTSEAEQASSEQDELEQVLQRLERQGRLSPQQRQKLAQDLALVDRSAWPVLIQYFLASAQWTQPGAESSQPDKRTGSPATSARTSWPGPAAAKGKASSVPSPAAKEHSAAPSGPQGTKGAESVSPGAISGGKQAAAATSQEGQAAASGEATVPSGSAAVATTSSTVASGTRKTEAEPPPSPQEQLERVIAALEQQTQGPARSLEELQRHVYLRMLYLAAGRREQALEPIPGIPAHQQQYWTNQFYALAVYLDGKAIPHSARRATEAKVHLDQAVYHLGAAANLVVKNLALCTAVRSYGVIGRFEKDEFRTGQVVLLYAELENFSVEETPQGYVTTLRGSYQIYDARGNQVASEELPVVEDKCDNRRRDFFVSYRIQLPERIYPGRHKLQLTIEDVKSQRMATGTLEFTVAK